MAEKDYYDALGVSRGASKEKIREAYRKLALQFHPDRNKDAGAEERFKEISEAYAVLSDDEKRGQYDRYGRQGIYQNYSPEDIFRGVDFGDIFGRAGFGGFEGFFSQFFGGGTRRPSRGEDLTYHLQLNLEDLVSDATKEIDVPRTEVCKTCDGSGAKPGSAPRTCSACGGTGQVQKVQSAGFARMIRIMACDKCRGRGRIVDSPCNDCGGRGTVQRSRKIMVVVPAGAEDGLTLRLKGEGNAGEGGTPPGDLYVMVNVRPHPKFVRRDSDIHYQARVNVVDAMLGAEIFVPTLYGDVTVRVPAGTQPNEVLHPLKGKGLPKTSGWGKGNEYVHVDLVVPKNLSKQQKELLRKFAGQPENL